MKKSPFENEAYLIEMLQGSRAQMNKAISWILDHSTWRKIVTINIRKYQMEMELTDEVFYECLTALTINIRKGSFKQESKLQTYFEGICLNNLKSRLSKKSTQNKYFQYMENDQLIKRENINSIESQEKKRQFIIRETVHYLLDQLSEKCRKILGYILLEYSMQEIADLLQMERQSIKNKAFKCRSELRKKVINTPNLIKEIKSLI